MNKKCPNCQDDLTEVQDVYLEEDNIYLIKDVKAVDLKFSLFPFKKTSQTANRLIKNIVLSVLIVKRNSLITPLKRSLKELRKIQSLFFHGNWTV